MKKVLFATLKEFLITQPKTVDIDIADKIYHNHIVPMQKVREELGVWITASEKSGYRPKWWEFRKGRSGYSQHTYIEDWINGSGAVDWTCKDFKINRDRFINLIIKHTEYNRICVYDTFIHCDYKETPDNKRKLYNYDGYKWQFLTNID